MNLKHNKIKQNQSKKNKIQNNLKKFKPPYHYLKSQKLKINL